MERNLEAEFETHFGRDLAEVTQDTDGIAQTLARMGAETNTSPAVLWVIPRETHLHLVLITPNGKPVVFDQFDVPKEKLTAIANQFTQSISNPRRTPNIKAAQQLHKWIIEPFEADLLRGVGVDTLLFCLGDGLRSLPLAALHDGEQFLIEKYSLSKIPAFNLISTEYETIQQGGLLAMGASEFLNQNPLPAVPAELQLILQQLRSVKSPREEWSALSLLNQDFTQTNLEAILQSRSFDIVHLATHADFQAGTPAESYIQFSDGKLHLQDLNRFAWQKAAAPAVELLVLSACRTAFGDSEAELGFAGVALQAGVKSAIASLWYISDVGTLAFMGDLYRELSLNTTKAEALRQTQIKMLRNEISFNDAGLKLSSGQTIPLSDGLQQQSRFISSLAHPYYWAGFSMISSPW
ncbi:MAG: CHAT domain-containing protein [Limnothrix sp. RL_2_0]|nr:CHAT domain-containing protein [Limnothrix sp. RL_2_0]